MSYDISLCDPVTHKPLKADSTHFIAGGMRAMGGTKELWLNVTYNYGHFYYRPEVFGEGGIRSIYGKTGRNVRRRGSEKLIKVPIGQPSP